MDKLHAQAIKDKDLAPLVDKNLQGKEGKPWEKLIEHLKVIIGEAEKMQTN